MWINQPYNPNVNSLFFWNSIFSGRKINRFSFSFRTFSWDDFCSECDYSHSMHCLLIILNTTNTKSKNQKIKSNSYCVIEEKSQFYRRTVHQGTTTLLFLSLTSQHKNKTNFSYGNVVVWFSRTEKELEWIYS